MATRVIADAQHLVERAAHLECPRLLEDLGLEVDVGPRRRLSVSLRESGVRRTYGAIRACAASMSDSVIGSNVARFGMTVPARRLRIRERPR